MIGVKAFVIVLGISLAQAYVHDAERIARSAENPEEITDPLPDDTNELSEEPDVEVAGVMINEDGDEIHNEEAIEKLIKTKADDESHELHTEPDELSNIPDDDEDFDSDDDADVDDYPEDADDDSDVDDIPEDDDDDDESDDGTDVDDTLEDDDAGDKPEDDKDGDDADVDDNLGDDNVDDADGDDTQVKRRRKRAAFSQGENWYDNITLWPKGIVPYVFGGLSATEGETVRMIMNYIEQVTCVRFVAYYSNVFRDNGLSHETVLDFGHYHGYGKCMSGVGRNLFAKISRGEKQRISPCANNRKNTMHEIFHALGSEHEHHRSDKYSVFQVHRNNLKTDSDNWNEVTKTSKTNNTYAYSLDSVMQYGTAHGSINGKRTMITYDKDIAYIENEHDSFVRYLDGKIINSIYKCEELRCPNHPHTCKNGGYVAYLNDAECRCVCPRGLGGDTCEEEYVPEPISSWPSGSYCLAADNTECSGTPLLTGYRKEHMNRMWHVAGDRALLHFSDDAFNTDSGYMYTHRFCCSGNETESANTNNYDWPRGTYCIFMYNDQCPSGFNAGRLRFDDENTNNQNELGGDAYPSGVYDSDITEFRYCCRDDGDKLFPMVMQNQQPFTLLPGKLDDTCQEVAGMRHEKMTYVTNTEGTRDAATAPYPKVGNKYGLKWMYYCHYTPLTYGCGGVETLDATRRSVTITSPNYPDAYNNDNVCSWTIKSPENTIMKMEFAHFNINRASNCMLDFLEVRHWNAESPGEKYCGVRFPRGKMTYQNQMLLELQTSYFTPSSGFNATISLIDDSDLTYRTSRSYAGKVSYTQQYEKCLPWYMVSQCPYSMLTDTTGLLGAHNYCRNPAEQFSRPWCYVDANCYTDVCDVGGVVDCYDKSASCASLMSNASYCGSDTGFQHCHKSCGFCGQNVQAAVDCGSAPNVSESMVMTSAAKDAYLSGDVITYKEKYSELTQERVCLTTGQWSGSDDMFSGSSGCPHGWVQSLPGRCYKLFEEEKNFYDAQNTCASYGGRLAIATTEQEQKALEKVLPNPRVANIRTYFGMRKNFKPAVFQWIDGRNLTYTKWLNYNYIGDCTTQITQHGSHYWDDDNCGFIHSYVCERFVTCGDGYYASGDGVCYKYHGEAPKSRDDAQAVCESEGGQLALGSTEQEHYAIVAVLRFIPDYMERLPRSRTYYRYMGLPTLQSDFAHFGLRRSANAQQFEWNNGSGVSFSKWAPSTYIGSDNCAALRWLETQKAYMWDDVSCAGSYPFVCQKARVSGNECIDTSSLCAAYQSTPAMCTHRYYYFFAYYNCRRTCGFCT